MPKFATPTIPMLQKLLITNYAIIDHLALEPDAMLNTITGETGAGKSIIVGALSLILGARADTSVLIDKTKKSIVEAHFGIVQNDAFKIALREEELDEEEGETCIIRREIAVSGKSRAFINDTPVTLPVLNKLTSLLVDLQEQFGHLSFEDDQFQMDVLDAIAGTSEKRTAYETTYKQWRETTQQVKRLIDEQMQLQKEADYKAFLLEELQTLSLQENEIENTTLQLKQAGNAEKILQALTASSAFLETGEQPMIIELRRIMQQLSSIAETLPEVTFLNERLQSVYAELQDISSELQTLEGNVSLDPERMQILQERFDAGYKLLKKHNVNTTAELLELQASLESELQTSDQLSKQIEAVSEQLAAQEKELINTALLLSEKRKIAAPGFAARINELLKLVGMPNAIIRIEMERLPKPAPVGMDAVFFLLDANKSGHFQPVSKAASGGEMSRIMLCIKSLTAKAMHLPTLIFDEVDTGISGEAAKQVGILLRQLAEAHQLICITHQPQVAARGTRHFLVYKDATATDRITTKIRPLQPEERVMSIARMIGGTEPGAAAIQHAQELVQ